MATGMLPWLGLIPPSLLGAAGTRMVFNQQTAPTGWTIDSSVTDHTLQLTAGGGTNVNTSGNAYSGMFLNAWTSGGHALTVAELAAHNHTITDPTHVHSINDPSHHHSSNSGSANFYTDTGGGTTPTGGGSGQFTVMGNANTGITLNATTTGITINNNGSGSAHTHTTTFNVNYCQCIVGIKT